MVLDLSDLELLTAMEIAATLKVRPQTIYNWIDAGVLPHYRIGKRRVRVSRSDLDAFLAGASGGASSAAGPAARSSRSPIAQAFWDGEYLSSPHGFNALLDRTG